MAPKVGKRKAVDPGDDSRSAGIKSKRANLAVSDTSVPVTGADINEGRTGIGGHKIIVGIDYGTTYTGVSYVATDKSNINDIAVVTTWPGPTRNTEVVFKAPSRIAYPFDNPQMQMAKWGFQVEGGMKSYSWTKLLLDRRAPTTEYDDADLEDTARMGILKLPAGKNAIDVAADFLESVYKHTMSLLAKQISRDALAATPIEFWFTMPAIWSDEAQSATRVAAQRAGFTSRLADKMFMITEPEAAAIATLKKATTDALSLQIKPGDGILICDCGGGTVDITTYSITEVHPRLQFEELCTGTGGKCGSSSIDRNLYRLMSDRFGKSFDNLPSHRKGPGSEFMKTFEQIKRDFGHSDEDRMYELPLNMTVTQANPEHFDEDERIVKITRKDVQMLFDPVIEKIVSLLKEQLTAANKEVEWLVIRQIILVGGFGDSEYLRQALVKEFASCSMTITVPAQPQAAIVKGAALRGLEGIRPLTRRCRRHYGYRIAPLFRKGIDAEEHSFVDAWDGDKRVRGVMIWKIEKGAKVHPDTTTSYNAYLTWYGATLGELTLKLYSCGLDDAPRRIEHPQVHHVGTIKSDLSNVDPNIVRRKKDHKGKRICRLDYELRTLFGAKDGILTFQTVVDNKVVGQTDIDFGKD